MLVAGGQVGRVQILIVRSVTGEIITNPGTRASSTRSGSVVGLNWLLVDAES